MEMEVDRSYTLVGLGGGVVTDLTGYVASIYMRGLRFGFIPTTILGLVDASIGGKNGVDAGVYKNIVGTIRQPAFILHDLSLLSSLPEREWVNGFAEVIKHACIGDEDMFDELSKNNIGIYQKKKKKLADLIEQNVKYKSGIVRKDEFEKNKRRQLNFGHTLGHALENQYELSHGEAISIGMTYASHISEELIGFKDRERVVQLLERYSLPTYASYNSEKAFDVMKMDKKRRRNEMNYVLLQRIGKAVVKTIPLNTLERVIRQLQS
jgi:3-dehydroquinate synthase